MKDFIYTKKFDNYLKGKLGEDDKRTLENAMQQDPLLKNEINLQQDIFKALHDERKVMLKNRLDKVPVNTATWLNLTGMQWAAILGSMLLISTVTYYYYDTSFKSDFPSVDLANSEYQAGTYLKVPEMPQPVAEEENKLYIEQEAEVDDDVASTIASGKMEKPNQIALRSQEKTQTKPVIPTINRPDILSDFSDENHDINYSDFEAPDKALLEKSDKSVAEVTIETVSDEAYSFHYQMTEQKLFLYGDFKGIPYKIIALNNDQSRQLFLKYKSGYYILNQQQDEIVPLEIINDSTIIKALERLDQ